MATRPPHDDERPSAQERRTISESSLARSTVPPNGDALTPLIQPKPTSDEPPTVISQPRKHGHFDSSIGVALQGRTLGHFELIEAVGSGGMATVIRARDTDLGRIVALKILPPEMAVDPENVLRFKNEAKAAAQLDHDNIARVYHFGEDKGLHYIAFEFVEGDNLRTLMEANGGRIPIPEGISILLQVTLGLAHSIDRGVVHRDIKPSNIIVTPDGRAKIVDMGLARNIHSPNAEQLTQTNVTLGTFDYISPEQAIEPRTVDGRSDIYSLGCTFYHAFTGKVPVPEGTFSKKIDAHKNLLPPHPRSLNPAIPDELAAILGKMMAKNVELRYQHPDHLAAHLRSLGTKLGIPMGPAPLNLRTYTDQALPPPPKLSLSLIVSTVAILLLVVFLLVNTNQSNEPIPPWPSAKQALPQKNIPQHPDNTPPPVVANHGPRDAEDTAEFVALLQQGVKHIRLVGDEYDLAAQNLEGLFQGDDLRIDGGARQPHVRLAHASTLVGSMRSKALTFRGTGHGVLTLRGIRFIGGTGESDADAAALAISGFERIQIEQCAFKTSQRPTQSGPTFVQIHGGQTQLKQCYFAPGAIGITLTSGAKIQATECAFGPHHALFHVTRTAEETAESEIKLEHCSALLMNGALIELDDRVPCQMMAGHCLFGGQTVLAKIPFTLTPKPPVIVRQRGMHAATTRYEALKTTGETTAQPNVYHNIAAYAEDDSDLPYSFAACAKERPFINDVEVAIKGSPWEARDPLALLDSKTAEPKKAFSQNLRLAQLRIPGQRQRALFGTMSWVGEQMHPLPLPAPESEPRDSTVKIWDPTLAVTDDLPPGVYPTLKMALAAVRKGDTLLIRYTGRLEVDPCEFDKADTNLTIKPEGNSRPLLVPVATTLKKANALFKLYGGRLVLDGLHFRLPADRTPALAAIPGSGHFECRNAIISFDEGEDLNAVVLADPKNEMMMSPATERGTPPKMVFENVVLRGKGRLLNVRGSRAFELDVKNSLAVLDGTFVEIDPASGDPTTNGNAIVRLNRCTTYLSGHLLHLKAGDKKGEMGPSGLAKTEVNATNCLFVPATDNRDAFVRVDKFDTREQVEKWFAWAGKNNLYGYDKKKVMLEIRVNDVEAMPAKMINGDRWLELASEEGDPFATVRFELVAPEAGRSKAFLAARPNDFRIKAFDPPRSDVEPELGAPTDLPRPFAEE